MAMGPTFDQETIAILPQSSLRVDSFLKFNTLFRTAIILILPLLLFVSSI
jgi:hypothetical protein